MFVVEQECPYPDLDGRDVEPETRHVLLLTTTRCSATRGCSTTGQTSGGSAGSLLAPDARGRGWADLLMDTALGVSRGRDVVLDAQSPLAAWYATFGFEVVGEEFLEDGIPHLPMRLSR